MKRISAVIAILAIAFLSIACDEEPAPNPSATPIPTTIPTTVPTSAPAAPTTAVNPNPTTVPNPTTAPNPTSITVATPAPSGSGPCNPVAITTISQREPAQVNGTAVRLQVRDTNNCPRPLFYNETGVNAGSNYKLNLPQGWTAITASVTAEVQRDGGSAKQYKSGPVVVVRGPFVGGAGLFEGAIRVVPDEWVEPVLDQTLRIQRQQVGNPNLQSVNFDG